MGDARPLRRSRSPERPHDDRRGRHRWEAFFSIAGAIAFTVGAAGTYSIGIDLAGAHAAEIPFRIAELA